MPVFYYELNHFAMAIAGEVAPDVSLENAYTFMQILDALYDSARHGEKAGLFSFRLFVHFIRKVAIRRSLGQRKVLD